MIVLMVHSGRGTFVRMGVKVQEHCGVSCAFTKQRGLQHANNDRVDRHRKLPNEPQRGSVGSRKHRIITAAARRFAVFYDDVKLLVGHELYFEVANRGVPIKTATRVTERAMSEKGTWATASRCSQRMEHHA